MFHVLISLIHIHITQYTYICSIYALYTLHAILYIYKSHTYVYIYTHFLPDTKYRVTHTLSSKTS